MHIQVSKFTSNLSPSVHVRNIASKANSRAIAIRRSFVSRDVTVLIRAYKTYVRPLVESNTVIWSPTAIGDADLLEGVQRTFTNLECKTSHTPNGLNALILTAWSYGGYVWISWCYKIIFGLTCLNVNDFLCSTPTPVLEGMHLNYLRPTALARVFVFL